MISNLEIENEIEDLESLQVLVETYQEIAAIRMRRVKDSVLKNREFLSGLNSIYQQVKASYRKEVKELLRKKRKGKPKNAQGIVKRNGKTVSVLLLANTMLYGGILRQTFRRFIEGIKNSKTDVVIVGKVGLQFYKEAGLTNQYKYFDLSDSGGDEKAMWEIIKHIVQYEKVMVYHGRFENMLTQNAVVDSISGDISEESTSTADNVRCIFEPTLEEVLEFFETEILGSIFEQTVLESNLSKFASRMISLDSATVSIKDSLEDALFNRQRIKHYDFNRKQLGALSGMSLWRPS